MQVDITLEGADALIAHLNGTAKKFAQDASRTVQTHAHIIANRAKGHIEDYTSQLANSIEVFPSEDGMSAEIGPTAEHGDWHEFGTGPIGEQTSRKPVPEGYKHGSKGHHPPEDAIRAWCAKRGITDEKHIKAIIWHIAHYGTRAHPYMWPAYEQTKPQFDAAMERLVQEVSAK